MKEIRKGCRVLEHTAFAGQRRDFERMEVRAGEDRSEQRGEVLTRRHHL